MSPAGGPVTGPRLSPDPVGSSGWLVHDGPVEQSYVDIADPAHLEFEYVQRIAQTIEGYRPPPQPLRVVHLGGGGLTLPRYLLHTRPGSRQIVFEPDAGLTAQVLDRLPLPVDCDIAVHPVDGRVGLARVPDRSAQVVIVDAFDGVQVPAELTTLEMLAELRRVLTDDGLAVVNIADRSPFGYSRRVLAGYQRVFGQVLFTAETSVLRARRFGNLVLAAAASGLPGAILRRAGRDPVCPYRVVEGPVLDHWVGGAAPFTDRDGARSPIPGGIVFP